MEELDDERDVLGNPELGLFIKNIESAAPWAGTALDFMFGAKPAAATHDPQWWAQQRPRPHRLAPYIFYFFWQMVDLWQSAYQW